MKMSNNRILKKVYSKTILFLFFIEIKLSGYCFSDHVSPLASRLDPTAQSLTPGRASLP